MNDPPQKQGPLPPLIGGALTFLVLLLLLVQVLLCLAIFAAESFVDLALKLSRWPATLNPESWLGVSLALIAQILHATGRTGLANSIERLSWRYRKR